MKAKNLLLSIAAGSLLLMSCGGEATKVDVKTPEKVAQTGPKNLKVDLGKSVIKWKGEMMGMYAHEGTLMLKEGSLTIDNGVVTGGSFVADMSSMVATDANFDPSKDQTKEKLIGHLSSADFFAVDTFPTASFTIKDGKGNMSMGSLMMKGKTGDESIENIVITEKDGVVMASGTIKIDRKKYDVMFDHPAKEMVLSNDIELTIELVAM